MPICSLERAQAHFSLKIEIESKLIFDQSKQTLLNIMMEFIFNFAKCQSVVWQELKPNSA